MIVTTLLLFTPYILATELYTTSPLNDSSGIFYHDWGYAKISTDQFSLISFKNVSFMTRRLEMIKSTTTNTVVLCSNVPEIKHCQNPLNLISSQIPILQSKFETMTHLVGHVNSERKLNAACLTVCPMRSIGFLVLPMQPMHNFIRTLLKT